MSATLLLVLGIQAAGALLTALVFARCHARYGKRYLRHWSRSWLAAAVMLLATALELALVLARGAPLALPTRLVLATVEMLGAFAQAALFLVGTHEVVTGRRLPWRGRRALYAALGALASSWALAGVAEGRGATTHAALHAAVHATLTGIFLAGAARLARHAWRTQHAAQRAFGQLLIAGGIAVYGLLQLQSCALDYTALARGGATVYAIRLGLLDLLLQFAMAIGLVVWLLEDERQRARDASAQAEHLALYDPLTGLPNRRLLLDRLAQAIAHARRCGHLTAVLFLDIDRFQVINESVGHGTGDAVLRVIAARARALLRSEDTVARTGGDELTVLALELADVDDALAIAGALRDAAREPMVIGGRELFTTVSVGIALCPDDGTDAELLLRNADTALYRAKALGRDTVQLYAPTMNAHAVEQLALESQLHKALARGQMEVFYQPVVELPDGRACAVEALLRWRHPEHGLLLPQHFIRLAEATGLIVPLGEWVLREACRQARRWLDAGLPVRRMAINLSVRQLQQPDFVLLVEQVLGETGLPPSALELEITESIAMQSDEAALAKLRELKRLGVRISIDDFGTGYSSLSLLRLFPADALKIDRSFVRGLANDENDAAIADSVIALAHALGLDVVAEGVETAEQLQRLRAWRCDYWQGFLCSEALPAHACTELLRSAPSFVILPAEDPSCAVTRDGLQVMLL